MSGWVELAYIIVRCLYKSCTCTHVLHSQWIALTLTLTCTNIRNVTLLAFDGGGFGWGGGNVHVNLSTHTHTHHATLFNVKFSSNKMWCYFKLTSCHTRNATLIKHTSCNINVATLLDVNLISNKLSCYLKLTSYHIKWNVMLLEVQFM